MLIGLRALGFGLGKPCVIQWRNLGRVEYDEEVFCVLF